MEKRRKVSVTVTLDPDTKRDLEKYCNDNKRWNMSVFTDVAIQEKIEREKKE